MEQEAGRSRRAGHRSLESRSLKKESGTGFWSRILEQEPEAGVWSRILKQDPGCCGGCERTGEEGDRWVGGWEPGR